MVYEKELKKLLKLMDAFKKSGIKEFDDPELDNMVYEAQAIGKAENNPKKLGEILKEFNKRCEKRLKELGIKT